MPKLGASSEERYSWHMRGANAIEILEDSVLSKVGWKSMWSNTPCVRTMAVL
jgi:hypothetical protein